MVIAGAILDFDGTLVDSLDAWRDLENLLVEEAGARVSAEDRAQFTTFTLDETACWFHEQLGIGASARAVRATMDEYMVDHLKHSARVLPGVREFLTSCGRQGIVLSVVSSSPQLYLQTALEATDLRPFFSQVVSVEDMDTTKREPFIFDHVCELMGTPREATWGFDDSLYALDVLRGAGYPTVGLFDPHEGCSLEQWADRVTIVVRSFEELSIAKPDGETTLVLRDR